ncbi:MAG: hypothetical protein WDM80_12915 [Limisphaerales bacterium]
MKSPVVNKKVGMVAILDALGAATYGDKEIKLFLESRQRVLDLLGEKIQDMPERIGQSELLIFTFNDTILIVYQPNSGEVTLGEIDTFFVLLRKFLCDSLAQGILFRGSVAIGSFFADNESNTVMGQAVTDAAAWYEKADWMGIQATPRANMIIDRWIAASDKHKTHLFLNYLVPLKEGKTIATKAVNWPRMFYISSISPFPNAKNPREKVLELLSNHSVPLGTEQKFFNTIAFFDESRKKHSEEMKAKK